MQKAGISPSSSAASTCSRRRSKRCGREGRRRSTPPGGQRGLGPAASKVYNVERGVSIGGYGEMLYQSFASETEDGSASAKSDQLDFLRAIVYVGYKFNDRIHFNSEIEFEHASTGKGGEVSVEFAYLDFSLRPELGIRGGMLLVPMGFINELHEPPIFYGARRPEVESAIIPTTWRENGAGIFGEAGPVEYRAYAVAGLDASGFSASGIRGGRQKGARSLAEDFAFTGRVDLTSVPGLLAGISFLYRRVRAGNRRRRPGGERENVALRPAHAVSLSRAPRPRSLCERLYRGRGARERGKRSLWE